VIRDSLWPPAFKSDDLISHASIQWLLVYTNSPRTLHQQPSIISFVLSQFPPGQSLHAGNGCGRSAGCISAITGEKSCEVGSIGNSILRAP